MRPGVGAMGCKKGRACVGGLWSAGRGRGLGEEGNTGLGKEEQGWGVRAREETGRAEGHQEGGKDIWGLSLILHPGWAQLAVQRVRSREQMHSAHGAGPGAGRGLVVVSCSWGQSLGKGAHPRRKQRRRRAGPGPRAEAAGRSAEAMLGAARPPLCFTHLHLGAVPFSLTMGTGAHVPAKPPVLGMEILPGVMLQFIPATTGRAAC